MTLLNFWRSSLDPERVMNTEVTRWRGKDQEQCEEFLTVEEPLELRLGGRPLAMIMRTPGHDEALAAGFLFSEGLIRTREDVQSLRVLSDSAGIPQVNVLEVTLREDLMAQVTETAFHRSFAVSSSCGLCGRDTIADALSSCEPLAPDDFFIPVEVFYEMPVHLRKAQSVFTHTGGLHAAGLFNSQGELLLLREDIGRHNAVDKLIGHGFLQNALPYSRAIVLVSGRTSFEIVQKSIQARIPCLAAISAPSSLAVELADQGGITLIGFLRDCTMNIYTHPERIQGN